MEKIDEKNPVIKIVITGPESTGKTTLAQELAKHFDTDYVPEFAREYLHQKDGQYSKDDLLQIAKGQIDLEERYLQQSSDVLICDTSLEVIRVWSEWKYGGCDSFILDNALARTPDLFILCTPDLIWKPDPLRENPDEREALFSYYQKLLAEYSTKIVELRGTKLEKLQSAIKQIQDLI